jgi:hypothetical protein
MLLHMKRAPHALVSWVRRFCLSAIAIAAVGVADEACAGFMPPVFDAVISVDTHEVAVSRTQWAEPSDPFIQSLLELEVSEGIGSKAGNSNILNFSAQTVGISERGREEWLLARQYSGYRRERIVISPGFLVEVMRPPKMA